MEHLSNGGTASCQPGASRVPSNRGSATPVVVFAYKRADHLRRTIESLRLNSEASAARLYVYCDGARRPEDEAAVSQVRSYAESIDGFAEVTLVLRPCNFGLSRSITSGVSEVLQRHGRVIVLEDDLLLSPFFLRYMNEALDCYADDERVASIHGYRYPSPQELPETFFIKGADCWGWATWSRAWKHFEPDGQRLLASLRSRNLAREFDFDGSHPYTAMLEDQVSGRNDSWAIRWYASCFLDDMLTLYPGRSLVENIGNDASGTHSAATSAFSQELAGSPIEVERIPLFESSAAREAFTGFFRAQHTPASMASRARLLLRNLYKRVA